MDPKKVFLGLQKALEFFFWLETHFGFDHSEITCRDMACLLVKCNDLKGLWDFLRQISRGEKQKVITTASITCLMKCLGEEGFVKEALATFYRMKEYHCKPDVYAYNTIINALCRVRNFKKARDLVVEMVKAGLVPREYTYKLVLDALSSEGLAGTLNEKLHNGMRGGIEQRYRRVMKIKPVMARKEVVRKSDFYEIDMNQNSATEELET